jgi:hypothetical protein
MAIEGKVFDRGPQPDDRMRTGGMPYVERERSE